MDFVRVWLQGRRLEIAALRLSFRSRFSSSHAHRPPNLLTFKFCTALPGYTRSISLAVLLLSPPSVFPPVRRTRHFQPRWKTRLLPQQKNKLGTSGQHGCASGASFVCAGSSVPRESVVSGKPPAPALSPMWGTSLPATGGHSRKCFPMVHYASFPGITLESITVKPTLLVP